MYFNFRNGNYKQNLYTRFGDCNSINPLSLKTTLKYSLGNFSIWYDISNESLCRNSGILRSQSARCRFVASDCIIAIMFRDKLWKDDVIRPRHLARLSLLSSSRVYSRQLQAGRIGRLSLCTC